ncbi:MAG: CHAT domain-containing protein [Bacteroidota bacterium]
MNRVPLSALIIYLVFSSCHSAINKAQDSPSLLKARSFIKESQAFNEKSQFQAAWEKLTAADSLYQKTQKVPPEEYADFWYEKGRVSYNLGLNAYQTCIDYLSRADSVYKSIDYVGKAADCQVYLGNAVWYQKGLNAALPYFEEAIRLAEADEKNTRRHRGKYYADMAIAYQYQYRFDLSTPLLEKARRLDSLAYGPMDKRTLKTLLVVGDNDRFQEEYHKAADTYRLLITRYLRAYPSDEANMGVFNATLGNTYFQMGNFIAAEDYLKKAYQSFSELPANHPNKVTLYLVFLDLYNNLDDDQQVKKWSELASQNVGQNNPLYVNVLIGQGLSKALDGQHLGAIDDFHKAIGLLETQREADDVSVGHTLENVAESYIEVKNYEGAEAAIRKAEKIYFKKLGKVHPSISRLYAIETQLNMIQGKSAEAQLAVEKGIKAGGGLDALAAFEGNPNTWINLLGNAVKLHVELGTKQQSAPWKEGLVLFDYLDRYLDHLKASYSSPQEIQALNKDIRTIYHDAIHLCYALYDENPERYFEQALRFSEKSKNYRLLESLQRLKVPGLKTYQRKQDYYQMMSQYFQRKYEGATDSLRSRDYENSLVVYKDSIRHIREELRGKNPTLYADLVQIEHSSSKDISANLKEEENMFHFTLTDKGVYALVFGGGTKQLFLLEGTDTLQQDIFRFRQLLSTDFIRAEQLGKGLNSHADTLFSLSEQLFQRLIAPLPKPAGNRTIIIPDGAMAYLPFELLLMRRANRSTSFSKHTYWGIEQALIYQFSATLWCRGRQTAELNRQGASVAAFAPFCQPAGSESSNGIAFKTPDGQAVDPLRHSRQELEAIREYFSGTSYINPEASIDRLEPACEDHTVLHLSTHGFANNQLEGDAYLLLAHPKEEQQAKRLYLGQVIGMRLNAEMGVISACESGIGLLDEGEGVISLTRAFTQAGMKSLLTSLWKVDERTTAKLMGLFYSFLKEGLSKDEALQKAKEQYLQSIDNLQDAHPYYWGGFVLTGSTTPLL